jgi:GTPase
VQKRPSRVVLVGRPNVGKSTLFNRISGSRRSIVTPVPGTTRDVILQPAVWRGVGFQVVDTGGIVGASQDPLHDLVGQQGRRAVASADLAVFIVDGRDGKTPADEEIARLLRSSGIPVVMAINKIDDRRAHGGALEFYQFGFEPVLEIAAEHGQGVGDLLDVIVERLAAGRPRPADGPPADEREDNGTVEPEGPGERQRSGLGAKEETSVAVIGRPNVGKSSLVNSLLREERVLVSDVPGTTRDVVDATLRWHKRQFRIVDTAGIRRPGRVARGGQVESVSVLMARRAVEQADVAVILIDSTEGVTDQDAAIAGEADKAGRGLILAANKWDLMKGRGEDYARTFDAEARRRLKFLDYAPLVHISALTGERTGRLLELIDQVAAARRRRVATPELNRFVESITRAHPPASPGRKEVRILYATQARVAPPTFVFFTNVGTRFHFSYERFVVNRLREAFGFIGTPIRLEVRPRSGSNRSRAARR